MKNFKLLTMLAATALCSACVSYPQQHSMSPASQAGWESSVGQPGAVLYGRDGSPVGNSDPLDQAQETPKAVVSETEEMPHRPEEAGGSRPRLLELYQEAMTERENLAMQLDATQQALLSTEDRMLDLEKRLEREIQARQAAEKAHQASEEQSFDLGRRLSVAQMRRLEAEKLLLEKTLAERRQMAEEAQ